MNDINITVGSLVLVCEYGSDPYWCEVISMKGDVIWCTNGHGISFRVHRADISQVTDDDSVLK